NALKSSKIARLGVQKPHPHRALAAIESSDEGKIHVFLNLRRCGDVNRVRGISIRLLRQRFFLLWVLLSVRLRRPLRLRLWRRLWPPLRRATAPGGWAAPPGGGGLARQGGGEARTTWAGCQR